MASGVQGEIDSMARSIKDAATAMLDPDEGYNLDDFEVKDFEGILANGKVVRTKTDHATDPWGMTAEVTSVHG